MMSPKQTAWDERFSLVASSIGEGKLYPAATFAQRVVE